MNYCPQCGHGLKEGANFCVNCGQELKEPNWNSGLDRFKALFKNKRMLTVIGIMFFILIFVLSINLGKHSPSDVAKQFIEYASDGNEQGAKSLISSGIDKNSSRFEHNLSWYTYRMPMGEVGTVKLDEYRIEDVKIKGDNATITLKFIFENGRRDDVHIKMKKEHGKWRVSDF